MLRPRRSVVFVCIAVVALAAFLPGVSAFDDAVLGPSWVLLPDLSSIEIPETTAPADEQSVSQLSLLPSRAPPAISLA